MSYLKDREIWLSNVPTGNPPAGYFWKFIQNGKVVVRDSSGNNQIMVATSGSQAITGSLTVTGGITGTATTASYVEYSNVANKPALVSGSSQITYSGLTGIPSGIVSGSAQIADFGIFATTGSNGFNGSQSITGSLTVTGQVVAQTLNVQQVTSSVVFSSGSNVFGNSLANTQQFTGSLQVSGSSHYVLGNVGIGTTSPSYRLDVNGPSGNIARITDGTNHFIFYAGSGLNEIATTSPLLLTVAGSERLRITSNGNLGLGVTPSAWSLGGSPVFQIGSGGVHLFGAGTQAQLGSNTFFNGSAYIYTTSYGATRYVQNAISGQHQWEIAPSGTAGNAISFTQAMTLTSGGNLLVGTTSDNGARLQVNGSMTVGSITGNPYFIGQVPTYGPDFAQFSHSSRAGADQYSFLSGIGGDTYVNSVNAQPIRFRHNNSNLAMITSDGNLIINPVGGYNASLLTIKAANADGKQIHIVQSNDDRGWRLSARTDGHFYLAATYNGSDSNILNARYDTGNVGIGTSSPLNKFAVIRSNTYSYYERSDAVAVFQGVLPTVLVAHDGNSTNEYAELKLGNNHSTYYPFSAYIRGVQGSGIDQYRLEFGTAASAAATTKMVITTGGNVEIGLTSNYQSRILYLGTATNGSTAQGGQALFGGPEASQDTGHESGAASGTNYHRFIYSGAVIGSITQNGTTQVSYNTSSDYRLKTNLNPINNALQKLSELNPLKFNFISEPENEIMGFLAHEVQQVVPNAVHGQKDAIDGEGNPVYQGIDHSKLIPLLTAALQEQQTLIESLKSRIEILEQ